MRTHGKNYRKAAEAREISSTYQPKHALEIIKTKAFAKFDETVDVAIRLGVDPRHADQIVRGTVVLPAGSGKTVRVLVIAVGDKAKEAEAAGADFVGTEYVAKIKEGWLDFDIMIATPDQMGQIGALGRVLGPRGLMPNPKAGTVTFDVAKAVKETKDGKIACPRESLETNFQALMDTIVRSKPSAAKGVYVKTVAVSSTMGPGVRVDTTPYR